MQGSVRRNQQTSESEMVTSPNLHQQLTIRFLVEDFLSVGHDCSVCVSLAGVVVRLGVRPSQDGQGSRDVELVISTQNTENLCIWSEQVIRSYRPSVPSLRSKLCQVRSSH